MPINYYLNQDGSFTIENYNFTAPFCSFLPGIAGIFGKPMWSFYINRGQGLCSFGVENRDNMITEFFPADQAYQFGAKLGFRTFYKVKNGQNYQFSEAFLNQKSSKIKQKMVITSYDVTFEERNLETGIMTKVTYFTLPEEDFPAMMRKITITNISSQDINFELLDGLPKIMPYGMNEFFCKNMSRTSQAWMSVKNLEDNFMPFFQLKVLPLDEAKVKILDKGNFFFCIDDFDNLIKPIVDFEVVFGNNFDYSIPERFFIDNKFDFPKNQIMESKTPASFIHYELDLEPGQSKTFFQMIGQIVDLKTLLNAKKKITNTEYFLEKEKVNKNIIFDLQKKITTFSNSNEFDYYLKQSFLDNVLRGGFPFTLAKAKDQKINFYLYGRKHGDLERDYNQFTINPTYFSEGNGNYRDVNQNRRNDLFFNLNLDDENIWEMMNLIQLDGYNPLGIIAKRFTLNKIAVTKLKRKYAALTGLLTKIQDKPQVLGKFFEELVLSQNYVNKKNLTDSVKLLEEILLEANFFVGSEHKEGFWSDHWHYNLDLIESFLGIYPEKIKELFFENKKYTFYDDAYLVLPRLKRYHLNEKKEYRQVKFIEKIDEKAKLIAGRKNQPNAVRIKNGKGEIYYTNLAVKLISLILIKACSIDPDGVGLEMESGKPNWYDAINGLPALFGSSSSELFELKRFAKFVIENLADFTKEKITLPCEIFDLYNEVNKICQDYILSKKVDNDLTYWLKANEVKEVFRAKTLFGISGKENVIGINELIKFCELLIKRIDVSIAKIEDKNTKVNLTYFSYDLKELKLDKKQDKIILAQFKRHSLPLFLEGPVHQLRLVKNSEEAYKKYSKIKSSELFDSQLALYKVNSSLKTESIEIGRTKIFTPGWLENESVWLHMLYKFLLEILRSGLNNEFSENLKELFIAFRDPFEYKRSILENSSFIASSAFPDKNMVGQGFVARLTGSTAEIIHIWKEMFFGAKPFILNNKKQLVLEFKPKIPYWLFTEQEKNINYQLGNGKTVQEVLPVNSVMAYFLGYIPVFYYNDNRKNTWDAKIVRIVETSIKDEKIEIKGSQVLKAEKVREGLVKKIEVFLE